MVLGQEEEETICLPFAMRSFLVAVVISLSPANLARIKAATDLAYPALDPALRLYLNQQLLESTSYYEVTDWLDRLPLTAAYCAGERLRLGKRKTRTEAN